MSHSTSGTENRIQRRVVLRGVWVQILEEEEEPGWVDDDDDMFD